MDIRVKKTKRAIQKTFIDLLREKPIEKITVKEIAERCGYINDAAFIRVFKKLEGMTPGQFREKHLLGLPLANDPADQ